MSATFSLVLMGVALRLTLAISRNSTLTRFLTSKGSLPQKRIGLLPKGLLQGPILVFQTRITFVLRFLYACKKEAR
ncbi:hypothetical protein GQ44DRAFT_696377 [Phaeosphaeriaceae sp. PMI808]|nr:hypothetical protein GQ44DRAFT_696377 [Phaeosphaeriaceae sp. PMI808]